MRGLIVFIESVLIVQVCSTKSIVIQCTLAWWGRRIIFFFFFSSNNNVHVELWIVLKKNGFQLISSFLRSVSRFSAIFPYRDVYTYKNIKNSHVGWYVTVSTILWYVTLSTVLWYVTLSTILWYVTLSTILWYVTISTILWYVTLSTILWYVTISTILWYVTISTPSWLAACYILVKVTSKVLPLQA
jgi:hypothetical protein